MKLIRLQDGSKVSATITDMIDDSGRQYSLADVRGYKRALRVVDRDAEGPIWGIPSVTVIGQ